MYPIISFFKNNKEKASKVTETLPKAEGKAPKALVKVFQTEARQLNTAVYFTRENVSRIARFLSHDQDIKNFLQASKNQQDPLTDELHARQFLKKVVLHQLDEVEDDLIEHEHHLNSQWILTVQTCVTDNAGRVFNCSAYEYAFWAKDYAMCQLLERYMDDETKQITCKRIKELNEKGLTYQQGGQLIHGSTHYDLTTLKNLYQSYLDNHGINSDGWDFDSLKKAWDQVIQAKHELPKHMHNLFVKRDAVTIHVYRNNQQVSPLYPKFAYANLEMSVLVGHDEQSLKETILRCESLHQKDKMIERRY